MEPRPLFIVVDGLDGCGKSTLVEGLCKELWGVDVPHLKTLEPSFSQVGLFIRNLLHTPEQQRSFESIGLLDNSQAMAYLFAADRILHAKVVERALGEGKHVVCDRWFLSSMVYQNGVTCDDESSILRGFSNILSVNRFVLDGILPDLIVHLKVTAKLAEERLRKSRANWGKTYFETDQQLVRAESFWDKAVAYYRNVLNRDVVVLDGTAPAFELVNRTMRELVERFPWFPRIPKEGSK